jgi:hypothetical protein
MKRNIVFLSMTLFFAMVAFGTHANAYPTVGEKIYLTGPNPNFNNGGVFTVSDPDGVWADFSTFCLERNEYVNPPAYYFVGSISNNVVEGGTNDDATEIGFDSLSNETKFLYAKWLRNETNGYSGENFQEAIWYYEDEIDTINASLKTWVETDLDLNIIGSIRAMNLVDASGNNKQSMLTAVPEPGTMLLLGLGLLGLAGYGRRKFRK